MVNITAVVTNPRANTAALIASPVAHATFRLDGKPRGKCYLDGNTCGTYHGHRDPSVLERIEAGSIFDFPKFPFSIYQRISAKFRRYGEDRLPKEVKYVWVLTWEGGVFLNFADPLAG
jgi:hypothetical protein